MTKQLTINYSFHEDDVTVKGASLIKEILRYIQISFTYYKLTIGTT